MTTNDSASPKPKRQRRYYQFSMRTLLLVVLVAVIGIGWYGSKLQQIRKRQRAADDVLGEAARIENLGGKVVWGHTRGVTPGELQDKPHGYPGDSGIYVIDMVVMPQATDADLKHLVESTQLTFTQLDLSSSQVSDDGLKNLTGLSNLRRLRVDDTNVTDDGANRLKEILPNLKIIPGPEHLAAIANLKQLGGTFKISSAEYSNRIVNGREFYLSSQAFGNRDLYVNLSQADVADADLVQIKRLAHPLYSMVLVLRDRPITDTGLEHLEMLTGLQHLVLAGTQISDAGLMHLKGLTELVELDLEDTQVGDVGLVHIKGLSGLVWLDLGETGVTDAGLKHLKEFTRLVELRLDNDKVTDAGLEHLNGLTSLTSLDLGSTHVTDAGVNELKRALPKCKIQH